MDAIFFVLRTGIQWRSLPSCGLIHGNTANRWFKLWLQVGVFHELRRVIRDECDDDFGMDWSWLFGMELPPAGGNVISRTKRRKKREQAKTAKMRPRQGQQTGPHIVNSGIFSITDFARFSRTTRNALLHYDRIGLLPPVFRRKSSYRCYSSGQLAALNVIRILQDIGMSLSEIKTIVDDRMPEQIYEMLGCQLEAIDAKIEAWIRSRKLLRAMRETIHSALDIDEDAITVQLLPKAAIILGGVNDYSQGGTDYDALFAFYKTTHEKFPDLDLNYPVWGIFSRERVKRGDWKWPDRYYLHSPEGTDKRPSGLYAIGYERGGYGQRRDVYERLVEHMDRNNLEICGDAYEVRHGSAHRLPWRPAI
jgi:DNA-binding transcriptional MerR regulator